jgi:hypothetical protein
MFQRQRPGLLELNGNVYAGFGSFCDFAGNRSRGWLLGWNATTLAPVPVNQLDNTRTFVPGVRPPFFLSSIWMSGFGIAGEGTDLYFATGNSDCNFSLSQCPSTTTYNGTTNIQESVVRLNGSLTGINGIFNPGDVLTLDQGDVDLGAGGVLLLPAQNGTSLAVAGAKDGRLFLLDTDQLSTPLDTQQLDPCWCGPSYFVGPDGISRIVTSHGSTVQTCQVRPRRCILPRRQQHQLLLAICKIPVSSRRFRPTAPRVGALSYGRLDVRRTQIQPWSLFMRSRRQLQGGHSLSSFPPPRVLGQIPMATQILSRLSLTERSMLLPTKRSRSSAQTPAPAPAPAPAAL